MIAAVTCHWNFPAFKRPAYNLSRFVRHMERDGLPLYGIELVLDGQPAVMQGRKNWRVIRCSEKSILFQKEHLLNMAVQMVPPEYDKIITLDADVEFDDKDWVKKTELALSQYPVVQPFEYCYWLAENGAILKRRESIGKMGIDITWRGHPGFAMAFRREFFSLCGLYPYAVIGHGDSVTGCGLLGVPLFGCQVDGVGRAQHDNGVLLSWLKQASDFSGSTVSYLKGVGCWHNWHGSLKDRNYARRPKHVLGFNVTDDILINSEGIIEWTEGADPVMVKWVKDWFWARKEDGNPLDTSEQPQPNMALPDDPPSAAIVTCHNYGRFLARCLHSLVQQSKRFTHIVVVNDASTDNTEEICQHYAGMGVKIVKGEWKDFTKARLAGLASIPRPQTVLFVDADNWVSPNYHEALSKALDEDPRVGVAYGTLHYVNENETPCGGDLAIPYDYRHLRRRNYADACSLIRMDAYEHVGGWPDNESLTDWLLWLNITRAGWTMKLCPEAVLSYRKHGQNMNTRRDSKRNTSINVEVYRRGMKTTIVTLFSGRLWNLPRFTKAIEALEWNHENLHLVAIDNSNDEHFGIRLRASLALRGISHQVIVDTSRVIEGAKADEFSDSAEQRMGNSYALSLHLSRLYAKAREFIPASTDLVWSIEDDIEVPPDSLRLFCEEFVRHYRDNLGVISACVQNRFQEKDRLIGCTGDWKTYEQTEQFAWVPSPPASPIPVMAAGMMATIFRREVFDQIAFRPSPMPNARRPWYDWAIGREVHRLGWQWLLTPHVHAKHWQKDGTYLLPSVKVSQLNPVSS